LKLELHIEELLLDGFDPRDRHRIADELQRSLILLLRESQDGAIEQQDKQIERLDAGAVSIPRSAPSGDVGSHIAGAITQALNGRPR